MMMGGGLRIIGFMRWEGVDCWEGLVEGCLSHFWKCWNKERGWWWIDFTTFGWVNYIYILDVYCWCWLKRTNVVSEERVQRLHAQTIACITVPLPPWIRYMYNRNVSKSNELYRYRLIINQLIPSRESWSRAISLQPTIFFATILFQTHSTHSPLAGFKHRVTTRMYILLQWIRKLKWKS